MAPQKNDDAYKEFRDLVIELKTMLFGTNGADGFIKQTVEKQKGFDKRLIKVERLFWAFTGSSILLTLIINIKQIISWF